MLARIEQTRRDRAARLQAALNALVGQLQALIKVIVFGSFARCKTDRTSDLDLLVITPAGMDSRRWSRLLYEKLDRDVATDIIVYSECEFEEEVATSSFLDSIVKSGRVIY
ncbi:MAG: nucleotidyltransferase domain-containing protein [Bacillota bacterium]